MIEIQPNGSFGTMACSVLRATDVHRSHVRAERLVVYLFHDTLKALLRVKSTIHQSNRVISLQNCVNQLFNWFSHLVQRITKPSIGLIRIEKKSMIPFGWMTKPSIRVILIDWWMKKPSIRVILIDWLVTKPSIRVILIDWLMMKPSIRDVLIDWLVTKPFGWIKKPFGLIVLIDGWIKKPSMWKRKPLGWPASLSGGLTYFLQDKTFKNVLNRADNASLHGVIVEGTTGSIPGVWIIRYRWPQRLKEGCVC